MKGRLFRPRGDRRRGDLAFDSNEEQIEGSGEKQKKGKRKKKTEIEKRALDAPGQIFVGLVRQTDPE